MLVCIYNTDEGTKMVMGHHAKTKEELVKAIENDDYDNLLNKFDIKKKETSSIFLQVRLHAICSGSLIYEAQQSSDITYRVYDYHRKDAQMEMNVNCMYNNRLMLQQFHMFHLRRIVWLKQQLKMERGRSWYQVNFLQLINTK